MFAALEGFLEDEAPRVEPDESFLGETETKADEPTSNKVAAECPSQPVVRPSAGGDGSKSVHGVQMTMSVLSDASVVSLQEQLTWMSVDELVATAAADAATRSTVGSYFVGTVVGRSGLKSTARKQTMAFITLNVLRDVTRGQQAGEDHVSLMLMSGAVTWLAAATVGAVLIVQDVQVLPEMEKAKDGAGKSSKKAFTQTRVTVKVSEADQIVMVGRAAHVATCKGIRKDGAACTMIVDPRRAQYCSFHVGAAARAASAAQRKRSTAASPAAAAAVPAPPPTSSLRTVVRGPNSIIPAAPMREGVPRGLISTGTMAPAQPAASGARTLASFGLGSADKRAKVRVAPVTSDARSSIQRRASTARAAQAMAKAASTSKVEAARVRSLDAMLQARSRSHLSSRTTGNSSWAKDTTTSRPQLSLAGGPKISRPQGRRGVEQMVAESSRKANLERKLNGVDLEALKRARSSHDHEDSTLDRRRNARLDTLELREQANKVAESTFEVRVRAERCLTCVGTPWSERGLSRCRELKHRVEVRKDVLKRFFRCSTCRQRTIVLGGDLTVKETHCEHPPSAYRRVSHAAYRDGTYAPPSSGAVRRATITA